MGRQYQFNRPTDVAFDAAGNIFVADGYGNSRVVKYDKNGKFIKMAGTRGSQGLQFSLIHAIAVDAQGNVYGGSRSDQRIVKMDNDLNYLPTFDRPQNATSGTSVSGRQPSGFAMPPRNSSERIGSGSFRGSSPLAISAVRRCAGAALPKQSPS
jgi:DNA-binding beta-propeller fold protein YncE